VSVKLDAVRFAIHVLRKVELAALNAATALRFSYLGELERDREARITAMWKRVRK